VIVFYTCTSSQKKNAKKPKKKISHHYIWLETGKVNSRSFQKYGGLACG